MLSSGTPFELVVTHKRLAQIVDALLKQSVVALDTEANGYHRYPERVCLIQLATLDETFLIDPLSIADMSPIGPLLSNPKIQKVIHGADYDIRGLDRDWAFRLTNIFDTSIAARFAGMERIGLASALEECLHIIVEKPKRLQRADWSIRPLSDEAIDYAAGDVKHMLPLRDALYEKLVALGRTQWITEEFARLEQIHYSPPEPPELAYLTFKGSRTLDDQGRAVLKELAVTREIEARRRGVPPFRIIRTEDLVTMAGSLVDEEPTSKILRHFRSPFANRLRHAIHKGKKAQPEPKPNFSVGSTPRMTAGQQTRLKALKAWRNERANDLTLDPSVIWPAVSLDRLARDPEAIENEFSKTDVRRWQIKRFGEDLAEVLSQIKSS